MCKCCQAVDVVALHLLRANPGERRERERHLERITSETMVLVLWGGRFQPGRQFYTEGFFFAFVLISR